MAINSYWIFGQKGDLLLNAALLQTISGGAVSAVPLNTVGAATIAAVGIAAGVTTRGGTQTAAFTDTTDTAANIIAADPNLTSVGGSADWIYINNSAWPATLSAGSGVTIVGQTVVPANSMLEFLVTQSSAGAVTLTAINQGYFPHSGTVTANGATPVAVADANTTTNSNIILTLNTVGGTPHGAFVSAKTAGTGFSINSLAGDTSIYNYTILG
jgi:hypothetical protein